MVAQITRKSTFMPRVPPTRVTSLVSSTRSRSTCILRGMAPTSSRNSVPPSAISILPLRRYWAPVKEPFSWPNSSLSSRSSGTAPQLTGTIGK
ncbi:MAG TPA: hypothetical protein VFO85_03065 [Vicinamibacteria bacterium]|nr:hypothetical protein [Vicinamibacteria bacterium]